MDIMEVTKELAAFAAQITYEKLPDDVRVNAISAILDSLGTALAGVNQRPVELIRAFALHEGSAGTSTLLGTGLRSCASAAALANGASAHALDFDSLSLAVSGFVASPVLFAILALAEEQKAPVSGRQLVEAFVAGWEVEAAIARGLGVIHYTKGWHSTATLGHFGAAVGAGRLLGLDVDQIRSAIGIAASEASGLRNMVGRMTNPFHVGKAARNGVTAARLAESGFTAHPSAIETNAGFCMAFNFPNHYNLDAITAGLGSAWDLVDPGLVIKNYPCCGLIHSSLDAAIDLKSEMSISPEQVRKVQVAVHALVPPTMNIDLPKSGYEAKFSTPFCIATALNDGEVKIGHFSDARVGDPKLLDLMGRVEMVAHPELQDYSTFLEREFSEVTIDLVDGRRVSRRVYRINNRGSRGRPLEIRGVRMKFHDCVSTVQDPSRAMQAFDLLANPAQLDDVRLVTEYLL
jgi:2-methylcitrate dehydratase PrpD